MMALIILSIIDYVAMLFFGGLSLWSIVAFFTTGTFVLRKIGIHVKADKLMQIEFLVFFVQCSISLVFKSFNILTVILLVVTRVIFYLIVKYDDTVFIYDVEEEEREI